MDNLYMDNVGSLHFPVEPHCPRCCPAFFALWESLRHDPDQRSDDLPRRDRLEVGIGDRLQPGIVIGFISESVIGMISES